MLWEPIGREAVLQSQEATVCGGRLPGRIRIGQMKTGRRKFQAWRPKEAAQLKCVCE